MLSFIANFADYTNLWTEFDTMIAPWTKQLLTLDTSV